MYTYTNNHTLSLTAFVGVCLAMLSGPQGPATASEAVDFENLSIATKAFGRGCGQAAPQLIAAYGGKVYFTTFSDGTAMPSKVYAYDPGDGLSNGANHTVIAESSGRFTSLSVMAGQLYLADDAGRVLRFNGTSTTPVSGTPFSGANSVYGMAEFGGREYFSTSAGKVYRYDGQAFVNVYSAAEPRYITVLYGWNANDFLYACVSSKDNSPGGYLIRSNSANPSAWETVVTDLYVPGAVMFSSNNALYTGFIDSAYGYSSSVRKSTDGATFPAISQSSGQYKLPWGGLYYNGTAYVFENRAGPGMGYIVEDNGTTVSLVPEVKWSLYNAVELNGRLYVLGGDNAQAGYRADNVYLLTQTQLKKTLSGVPEYEWTRGCSPTSAAMVIGYWAKNGYPNLWDGTPPTSNDPNNDSDPVNVVIEHIGDLMKTSTNVEGNTPAINIPPAMMKYAKDKDAAYKFKAGLKFASWDRIWDQGSFWEGFSFEYIQKEVNAGRPMSVGLRFKDPLNPLGPFKAHDVVAYGYQDNPGTNNDWIAVMDTWVDGASTGGYAIPNKVQGGIEWWKWVTNRELDYYIYSGAWLIPAVEQHAVWGLLESSFSSATVFDEQFKVASTAAGGASLVALAGEPKPSVLRLVAEGAAGTDDTVLTALVAGAPKVDIRFDYAFETPGTLQVLLEGILIGEIVESAGVGVVDELADFSSFFREILLSDYGLDPDGLYSLELRLLAGSTHIAYLDSLQVVDPDAEFVPEPATLSLLALGGLAVLRRRRTQ